MSRSTWKCSTIFVAIGNGLEVYRSLNDVPQATRRRLADAARGWNSATIMIADRRGRDELVRAIEGRPSRVKSRLASFAVARQLIDASLESGNSPLAASAAPPSSRWKRWVELLTGAGIVVGIWLAFISR
jgi:hypothetical protein